MFTPLSPTRRAFDLETARSTFRSSPFPQQPVRLVSTLPPPSLPMFAPPVLLVPIPLMPDQSFALYALSVNILPSKEPFLVLGYVLLAFPPYFTPPHLLPHAQSAAMLGNTIMVFLMILFVLLMMLLASIACPGNMGQDWNHARTAPWVLSCSPRGRPPFFPARYAPWDSILKLRVVLYARPALLGNSRLNWAALV